MYFLRNDATPLPKNPLLVNQTKARIFTQDFFIETLIQIVSSASVVQLGGVSFKLNQVPTYANWTAVFDKYRFDKVELQFMADGMQDITQSAIIAPVMSTALDFDSDATPASAAEVQRKSRSTMTTGTVSFRRAFVPRVARDVYNGVASTNYEEGPPAVWLDCASAATPHYGLAYAMGTATNTSFQYRVHARFTISFSFPIA